MSTLIYVDDTHTPSVIMKTLENAYPEVTWSLTDSPLNADLCILGEKGAKSASPYIYVDPSEVANLTFLLDRGVRKGELILPTSLGIETFSARIGEELVNLEKLRRNNPLYLPDERKVAEELKEGEERLAVHALHPSVLNTYARDLKDILHRRVVRSLQRLKSGWRPVSPIVEAREIIELYPKVPTDASELRERLESIVDELKELDLTVSKSVMDKSQLSLGTFFAGGHNRREQGLTPPSETYRRIARAVAGIMLSGFGRRFNEIGEHEFTKENVRVGVKVGAYQGGVLNTRSHSYRQTGWAVMQKHGNNIFHFEDLKIPIVSGFRSSDNPSGKTRACYLTDTPGLITRSRVVDGEDLKGKEILQYLSADDPSDTTIFVDDGDSGARGRVIANVPSVKNDALLPIPAYTAKYKDVHYKYLYQQDELILSRFISGSPEFERFWMEGYESRLWVRTAAAERGFQSWDTLYAHIKEKGEFTETGDVVSFDGNANLEVTEPFLRPLLSERCYNLSAELWDADKIGVYCDHTGKSLYYYVTSTVRPDMSDEEKALVEHTALMMSALISGLGVTSQIGRGVVPTALLEIVYNEFGIDIPNFFELLEDLPSDEEGSFSFVTALMNSAGDDHVLGTLIIWLLTGIEPTTIQERLQRAFSEYKTLLIQTERPKMNAGWLFHDDESGRSVALSRSATRMFANLIYPEHSRSAIGLHYSAQTYINSAIGSPDEEKTLRLADLLITRVYGFDSLDHLAIVAQAEENYLITHIEEASPVQQISAILGIPQNDLEWKYTLDDLLEMGIDPALLDLYRRPIPSELTENPLKFFNLDTIRETAQMVSKGATAELAS